MKKMLFCLSIFVLLLSACAAAPADEPVESQQVPEIQMAAVQETAVSPEESSAVLEEPAVYIPMDVFSAAMNPFDVLDLPEYFTVVEARLQQNDYNLYNFTLASDETPDQILGFFHETLACLDESSSLEDQVLALESSGNLQVRGLLGYVEVQLGFGYDGSRVVVTLTQNMSEENFLEQAELMQLNFNPGLIPLEHTILKRDPISRDFRVNVEGNYVQGIRMYRLGEGEYVEIGSELQGECFISLLGANTLVEPSVSVREDEITVTGEQNGVNIELTVNQPERVLFVMEAAPSVENNISSYTTPSLTAGSLLALGFNPLEEDDVDTGYEDAAYDGGTYIIIAREAWGAEVDEVVFISNLFEKYHLVYDPDEVVYMLDMEDSGVFSKYYYDPENSEIWPVDPDFEMESIRDASEELTGMDFEEGTAWIVSRAEDYVRDTFGLSMEELFEAPAR